MTKNVSFSRNSLMAVFVLLIAIAFAGCDMLIGPQGEQGETGPTGEQGERGEQGEPGPGGEGLYLVDGDGVHVTSGESYDLGEVIQYTQESLTVNLRLLNMMGVDLELLSIAEIFSYVIRPDGEIDQVNAVNEISVQYTASQSVVSDSFSGAIEFSLDYADPALLGQTLARKRYRIELRNGEDDMFFDVDVYGKLNRSS